MGDDDSARQVWAKIDTSVPHSARIWNYWLGGKDNYEVDREAGDEFREVFPGHRRRRPRARRIPGPRRPASGRRGGHPAVPGHRHRACRPWTTPTRSPSGSRPNARIVYVDNDPLVLAHARALLTSTPEGVTDYVDADLRDPDTDPARSRRRRWTSTSPIALMLHGHPGQHRGLRRGPRRSCGGWWTPCPPAATWCSQRQHQHQRGVRHEAIQQYNEKRRLDPVHPAQPRADRRLLRRAGTGGARCGVLLRWRPDTSPWPAGDVAVLCGVGRKS